MPILLVLGWCLFNQIKANYFGISTLFGYSLTQHSGGFIELVPEKYSIIRDIYLDYRQRQIAQVGTHSMTIHHAVNAMLEATRLSYTDLSQELTRMSVELFLAHPDLYLRCVFRAWTGFWHVPIYWEVARVKSELLQDLLGLGWRIEHLILRGVNRAFLIIAVAVTFIWIVRRQAVPVSDLLILSTVMAASVLQAIVESGENARYSMPFQPLIAYEVLVWVWVLIVKFRQSKYAYARS